MAASIPPIIAAEAILLMAGRALVFLAPVIVLAALWWLAQRVDSIMERLFPHLAWERNLGWLNIRAERRARTALRWLGFAVYLALAASLVGIAWETRQIVDELAGWPDWATIGRVMVRLALLTLVLSVWLFFLGGWLLPKIRAEREDADLRRFRAEMEERERAREQRRRPAPDFLAKYHKPRSDSVVEAMFGQPNRMRRMPGE